MADKRELAAVFVGGAAGAVTRAVLSQAFPYRIGEWPWPTFSVNIFGCLMLGYLITRLQERLPLSAYRRPLLGTGFCGGLTTFSTMQVELLRMLDVHYYELAIAYLATSIAGGYLAVHLTTVAVRRVRVRL